MITEGLGGRLFEVTGEGEIVWEYLSPFQNRKTGHRLVYRGYRVPYQWIPQVKPPAEKAVATIDNRSFRVPGSSRRRPGKITRVKS
jgi:hypothetical protein